MPIDKIIPYEKNAKRHTRKQVQLVANSIKMFGFNQPIVVDQNNVIIVGHGRLEAAKLLGMKEVPTVTVKLSEEQAAAYRLADNKLNESEWDMALVIEELKGLSPAMIDLTGFAKDLIVLGNDKDDDVPSLPAVAQTKLGDLYEFGGHRLLCGDSTSKQNVDKLMLNQRADLIFTDQPYGIDYKGGRTDVVARKNLGKIKGDDLKGVQLGDLIGNIFSYNKADADIYICVSPIMQAPFLNFIESAKKKVSAVIVWDKKNAGLGYMKYRRQTEFILYITQKKFIRGEKSDFDLWSIGRDNGTEYKHTTQKPVALSLRAILNSSKRDDIVLDLFLGSGSTLVAAHKADRKCYGMELDPKFVDVIVQRYVEYTGNKNIIKNGKKIIWNTK